jgi:hypothetical protein
MGARLRKPRIDQSLDPKAAAGNQVGDPAVEMAAVSEA